MRPASIEAITSGETTMTRFARFLVAGLAALNIALAPTVASARPDGEDIAKTLAGLAVLGIIATAVDKRKDRRREAVTSDDRTHYGSFDDRRGTRIIDGTISRPGDRGPKAGRGYKQTQLPDRCLREVDTARGDRLVYGARCLNRNYKHASKLPERCERYVRTDRGLRTVYGARCLARDGWRVAGW